MTEIDARKPCPVCASEKTKFLFDSWDIVYGYPGTFPLWQCRDCRHIYLIGDFTPEMLTDLYSRYYPRSNFDVEQYKPYPERTGFLAWLDGDQAGCHRWVPENVRVLDIGCGYCETLGYHKARGCEAWGCDADENIQRIADRHGFNVHVGLFNADNYEKNYFDYVTIDQVFEHCVDPEEILKQIFTVLKPGGKLIIGMPNAQSIDRFWFGRWWGGWHTPYHLHIFSKKSADLLLEKTGYLCESLKCRTPAVNLLTQWALLFVHGKQGEPMRFQQSPHLGKVDPLSSEHERLWYVRLYRFLEKIRFFALPVRCADALGVGVNRIYIAVKPL